MLIKTVSTVVTTDSTGKPIDALPVRTASAGETDAAGRPVDIIQVTEDPNGVPVRFVTGKAAQNSAGQWVDTIPVQGGGGGVPATGRLIETYDSLTGFTVNNVSQTAMSLVTSGIFEGAGAIEMDALAGVSGASGEVAVYKMGKFDVTVDTSTDIGVTATLFYISPDSDRQINSGGGLFGKVSGAMAGAQASCPVPWGYWWAATAASENGTLAGLGTGTYGVKPAARGNTPFGQKLRAEVTIIKVEAKPVLVMGCDDCLVVQDAHVQLALDRGLPMYRAIPSASVGGGGFSSLATLLSQQATGLVELIPNATRSDQPVNTFGTPSPNRAAAVAEMVASKAACQDLGFNAAGLDFSVWPNGVYTDAATLYAAATMTGNGVDGNVTFGAALNASVQVGFAVMGSNVSEGTTVVSIAGDRLSAVLSKTIANTARPAVFSDTSGEFARDKFINDAKAAGVFKMVRATGANRPFMPWFSGPDAIEHQMSPGDSWTTATPTLVQTNVGLAITRKSVLWSYWHGDWSSTNMVDSFDWIKAQRDAGLIDVLTPSQLWARVKNGKLPLAV